MKADQNARGEDNGLLLKNYLKTSVMLSDHRLKNRKIENGKTDRCAAS